MSSTEALAIESPGERATPSSAGVAALFESARSSVRSACAGLDADRLSGPEVVSLFASVVEILRVATAAKLTLVSQIESSGVFRDRGHRTPASLVGELEGVGQGAATTTVQSARRLQSCPATEEAMRKGQLSENQARAITDAVVLAPEREQDLLGVASTQSPGQLAAECRRAKAASAGADLGGTYKRIHEARSLRHWTDEEGALRLEGRFTADVGARLIASVEAVANDLFEEARKSGSMEPLAAYRADALVGLACGERTAIHPGVDIHVRVDHEALLRGYPVGTEVAEIDGGGSIPVPRIFDLMSDAGLKVIFRAGCDISTIYHFTRTINAHLVTALVNRDPTCIVPGCGATRFLEIDHVVPVEDHGPTTLNNLARICSFHHARKTNEGWALYHDGERWHFDPPPAFGEEPGLGSNGPAHAPVHVPLLKMKRGRPNHTDHPDVGCKSSAPPPGPGPGHPPNRWASPESPTLFGPD